MQGKYFTKLEKISIYLNGLEFQKINKELISVIFITQYADVCFNESWCRYRYF